MPSPARPGARCRRRAGRNGQNLVPSGRRPGHQWCPGLQRQARKAAPVDTQRRLQIGDIAREELVGRLTQGGMSEENANVMLNTAGPADRARHGPAGADAGCQAGESGRCHGASSTRT